MLFGQELVVFLDTIGEHPEYAVDAELFLAAVRMVN